MKAYLLFLCGLSAWGASPCSSGLPVCLVNIPGDYTTSQYQTALSDAVTWQGVTCAPYVIQITAGSTLTGNFTISAKTCNANIETRSSGVGGVSGRVNPTQSAMLAKIQSNGGTVLGSVDASGAAYYAFRGIEFTQIFGASTYTYILVSLGNGNPGIEPLATQHPSNIEFDRCWIHGNDNEEGPDETLSVLGNNISIHDSYIEKAHSTYFDAQAILIYQSSVVSVINNYIDGAAENFFISNGATNITVAGNHMYKPPYLKYSNGTGAPIGTCFSDAFSGERYSQLAAAAPTSTNVSSVANNGMGLVRIGIVGGVPAGWMTNDKIQVGVQVANGGLFGVSGGALGIWAITVIDANHVDLQSSTFSGAWGGGGTVQKITQLWQCPPGTTTWTMTSSLFGNPWDVKDDWETKGCTHCLNYGNVMENAWPALQDECAIINQVNFPFTISDVQFYGNQLLNCNEGFVIGNNGNTGYPRGPASINIHDNLWPSLGIFGSIVFYPQHSFHPASVPPGTTASNITYRHNTTLIRVADSGTYQDEISGNALAQFSGYNVYSDNIISHGDFGITIPGSGLVSGWYSWNAMLTNGANSLFGHNIHTTVDQPGFSGTLTFASTPSSTTQFVYPTTDTWLHTADYTTVFTTTAGAVNTWNYKCLSSYASCHNAASDGRDIGADTVLVSTATASAVSGTVNPWLSMALKPPTALSGTTATIPYVAPTTDPCTLSVCTTEFGTSCHSTTDSGGNPSRSLSFSTLTTKTLYWPNLSCASGAYILGTSAQVASFVTK